MPEEVQYYGGIRDVVPSRDESRPKEAEQPSRHEKFLRDMAGVLNCHSIDSELNIPDFMLAEHLYQCLTNLRNTVVGAVKWGSNFSSMAHEEPIIQTLGKVTFKKR